MALYELVIGELPFEDSNPLALALLILDQKIEIPSWVDPDIAELILALLERDSGKRPTAAQFLDLPQLREQALLRLDPLPELAAPRMTPPPTAVPQVRHLKKNEIRKYPNLPQIEMLPAVSYHLLTTSHGPRYLPCLLVPVHRLEPSPGRALLRLL